MGKQTRRRRHCLKSQFNFFFICVILHYTSATSAWHNNKQLLLPFGLLPLVMFMQGMFVNFVVAYVWNGFCE